MQIEIFTICDYAQVYAGKAVVMGAFNQMKAQKLPVVVPNLTLAVRVSFEKEESGDKTFYFQCYGKEELLAADLGCFENIFVLLLHYFRIEHACKIHEDVVTHRVLFLDADNEVGSIAAL